MRWQRYPVSSSEEEEVEEEEEEEDCDGMWRHPLDPEEPEEKDPDEQDPIELVRCPDEEEGTDDYGGR